MSSGSPTASRPGDPSSSGWRLANTVAILSPYFLGGALILVLLFVRAPAVPRAAAESAAPPPPTVPEGVSTLAAAPAGTPPLPAPSRTLRTPAPVPTSKAAASATGQPAASARPGDQAGPGKEPPLPTQPVAVDSADAATMKLSGEEPAYPDAARGAHIQGVVVLDATIGPSGAVRSVQAVSGPALLEIAALNAARTWRYRPYLVYGKPVAFQTQIILDFRISSGAQ